MSHHGIPVLSFAFFALSSEEWRGKRGSMSGWELWQNGRKNDRKCLKVLANNMTPMHHAQLYIFAAAPQHRVSR